jgi:hypothetical protein
MTRFWDNFHQVRSKLDISHFVLCFCLFFFVLRTLCCQFLWIVLFWLLLWYSGMIEDWIFRCTLRHLSVMENNTVLRDSSVFIFRKLIRASNRGFNDYKVYIIWYTSVIEIFWPSIHLGLFWCLCWNYCCSVLSFLRAEWKVSDTGSAQCWASSCFCGHLTLQKEKCIYIIWYTSVIEIFWPSIHLGLFWCLCWNYCWKLNTFIQTTTE